MGLGCPWLGLPPGLHLRELGALLVCAPFYNEVDLSTLTFVVEVKLTLHSSCQRMFFGLFSLQEDDKLSTFSFQTIGQQSNGILGCYLYFKF
jgi:hypothetical protein